VATSPITRDPSVRYQVFLERVKQQAANDATGTIAKLATIIKELVSDIEDDNLGDASKATLKKLLAKLENVESGILNKVCNDLIGHLGDVGDAIAKFEVAHIRQLTKKGTEVNALDSGEALSAAERNPVAGIGKKLDDMLSDWKSSEIKATGSLVTKAFSNGWTSSQLLGAIRGTSSTDGLLDRLGRNAETVVKASMQHVASEARFAAYDANSDVVTGYVFIATLDANTTVECRDLDGTEYEDGHGPRPPLHWGCRSTTGPLINPKYALKGGDEGTRSSYSGYVDGKTTYYEWLADQSADFQDEALGPTRGKLFREGGLSIEKFKALNMGRNFQPMTLDEMRKLQPLAFKRAGV
jgi:SPP1 gp7 family putative phage head morphogenesis protein